MTDRRTRPPANRVQAYPVRAVRQVPLARLDRVATALRALAASAHRVRSVTGRRAQRVSGQHVRSATAPHVQRASGHHVHLVTAPHVQRASVHHVRSVTAPRVQKVSVHHVRSVIDRLVQKVSVLHAHGATEIHAPRVIEGSALQKATVRVSSGLWQIAPHAPQVIAPGGQAVHAPGTIRASAQGVPLVTVRVRPRTALQPTDARAITVTQNGTMGV